MLKSFSLPFGGRDLKGDSYLANSELPNILALHGAGGSNRKRYRLLREFLLQKGFSSCSFDLIGHGETGGDLTKSSLLERTEQARAVIKNQSLKAPLTLIGSSMGAYTAIKTAAFENVGTLVLLVPAVYSSEAYDIPFTDKFSGIIRQPKSWLHSDAWDILSDFRGKLLVIAAENDEVIPTELVSKLLESARATKRKELYVVPGASHQILRFLNDHPKERKIAFNKVLEFVT